MINIVIKIIIIYLNILIILIGFKVYIILVHPFCIYFIVLLCLYLNLVLFTLVIECSLSSFVSFWLDLFLLVLLILIIFSYLNNAFCYLFYLFHLINIFIYHNLIFMVLLFFNQIQIFFQFL